LKPQLANNLFTDFFIFLFQNKKNSKIYTGLGKFQKWGPVARWGAVGPLSPVLKKI